MKDHVESHNQNQKHLLLREKQVSPRIVIILAINGYFRTINLTFVLTKF